MSTFIIISLLVIYIVVGYFGYTEHNYHYGKIWNTKKVLHAAAMILCYLIISLFLAVLIYLIATL